MSAGLGWIDFSNEHRDKVFTVLDMLKESGTVDELGIGTVRDALADWLFPGLSTIHTRPKYFIILTDILWSYYHCWLSGKKMKTLETYIFDEEERVMHLLAKNVNYENGHGVIGVRVAYNKGNLARKPSSIYWNGLKTHGFLDSDKSMAEYYARNDLSEIKYNKKTEETTNYKVVLSESLAIRSKYYNTINEEMSLDLNSEEAMFLKSQFISKNGSKKQEFNLLAQLFEGDRIAVVLNSKSFVEAAQILVEDSELKAKTIEVIQTALRFNFLMQGAHIRYNILLQKKSGILDFSVEWEEWYSTLRERFLWLKQMDFQLLFNQIAATTKNRSKRFMRTWFDEVTRDTIDINILDDLVYKQETWNKGNKSKLRKINEEITAWVGIRQLDYRFPTVKTFIKDIHQAHV